jgi:hypothetical protein
MTERTLTRGRAPAALPCPDKVQTPRLGPPLAMMVQASAV